MPVPTKREFIDEGVRKVDEAIKADPYAGTPRYDLRNAVRTILEHLASFGNLEDEAPPAPAPELEAPPAPPASAGSEAPPPPVAPVEGVVEDTTKAPAETGG